MGCSPQQAEQATEESRPHRPPGSARPPDGAAEHAAPESRKRTTPPGPSATTGEAAWRTRARSTKRPRKGNADGRSRLPPAAGTASSPALAPERPPAAQTAEPTPLNGGPAHHPQTPATGTTNSRRQPQARRSTPTNSRRCRSGEPARSAPAAPGRRKQRRASPDSASAAAKTSGAGECGVGRNATRAHTRRRIEPRLCCPQPKAARPPRAGGDPGAARGGRLQPTAAHPPAAAAAAAAACQATPAKRGGARPLQARVSRTPQGPDRPAAGPQPGPHPRRAPPEPSVRHPQPHEAWGTAGAAAQPPACRPPAGGQGRA